MNQEELNQKLKGFYSTKKYHPSSFGKLNLTEGMHFLRENAGDGAYWLIDIIESVLNKPEIVENKSFIVWRIEVDENNKWKVTAWNDSPYESDLLYKQCGDYTDFPLKEFEFYQCDNILLLKEEY